MRFERQQLVLDVIHGIRSLRHTVKTLAPTSVADGYDVGWISVGMKMVARASPP